MYSSKQALLVNYHKIVWLSSEIYSKKWYIYTFNTFVSSDPSYLLKMKVIGLNWMKGARGGSLKIYISVLNLCSNRNIDYHKRSHNWYAWDFYQANQVELK